MIGVKLEHGAGIAVLLGTGGARDSFPVVSRSNLELPESAAPVLRSYRLLRPKAPDAIAVNPEAQSVCSRRFRQRMQFLGWLWVGVPNAVGRWHESCLNAVW